MSPQQRDELLRNDYRLRPDPEYPVDRCRYEQAECLKLGKLWEEIDHPGRRTRADQFRQMARHWELRALAWADDFCRAAP